MRILALLLVISGLFVADAGAEEAWTVLSPNKQIAVTLSLADDGSGELRYAVEYGEAGSRATVVDESPLGIETDADDFTVDLAFQSAGAVRAIDESYTMVRGKRKSCRHRAQEQTFHFANAGGAKLDVVFRVSNDGVAFRYVLPDPAVGESVLMSEATGVQLPAHSRVWMQPFDNPSKYTPAYERYFENGIPAGTESPTESGWALPGLFRVEGGDAWLLVTEAGLDGHFCGSRFAANADQGLYRFSLPNPDEGNGAGSIHPASETPWAMPWRVMVVGGLDTVVESTLVTDVSPACVLEDTDWIKPGRVSWSWWSDHDSPQNYESLRDFVDLAAEMGWEYSLVDANWTLMNGGDVRQLAKYAEQRGVGLLLWYNSGGENNSVTEKPRGCLRDPAVRRFEFELLRSWGIKGVKVDFFHSDKQDTIQQYLGILQDAAEFKLMINFHGCTIPRGWSRTYPNLMSMESVRGAECYTFSSDYPEHATWHNTILPFTRNAVGPMDYTPVTFSHDRFPHLTSMAHELALSVVFESGWQHLADSAESYRRLPEGPSQWLKQLPVVWDETRYAGGQPGQWAAIARRAGDAWYIGVINGEQGRTESLDLSFLPAGQYSITTIRDGESGEFDCEASHFHAPQPFQVQLPPRGGLVMRIEP